MRNTRLERTSDSLSYLDRINSGTANNSSAAVPIENAIDEVEKLEEKIYDIEKYLLDLKDRKEHLLRKYIPNLLVKLGINILETQRGYKVSIKHIHYLRVKDKDRLEVFLESRGDDGLMDTVVRIKKLPAVQRRKLRALIADLGGLVSKQDHTLHHSTQRKYFNDLIQSDPGQEIMARIESIGEIKDYYETKIKRPVDR